jgi:hypothetical protein
MEALVELFLRVVARTILRALGRRVRLTHASSSPVLRLPAKDDEGSGVFVPIVFCVDGPPAIMAGRR